eukprot:SAG31_NODE_31072_length_372_cov_1.304029_2_plen_51_part_01
MTKRLQLVKHKCVAHHNPGNLPLTLVLRLRRQVLEAIIVNSGISWGVDDLE